MRRLKYSVRGVLSLIGLHVVVHAILHGWSYFGVSFVLGDVGRCKDVGVDQGVLLDGDAAIGVVPCGLTTFHIFLISHELIRVLIVLTGCTDSVDNGVNLVA